jgi:hypothetical protein
MWYLFLWNYSSDDTPLYCNDQFTGSDWTEHPNSPLLTGDDPYANGGRPHVKQGVVGRPGKGGFILRLENLNTSTVDIKR